MCRAFVSNSSSLPKRHHRPSPFLFFSLLLSSGRLDYVAKEIFLFLSLFCFFFFAFFTVSHWFGVNAFWMPLGVCRALGEEGGAQGLAEWRNFNLKRLGGGPCGLRPKERHSSENWSGLQSRGTSPAATPPLLPRLFFRVTPSLVAHRCTVNLSFSNRKTKPWVKQTYFFPSVGEWEEMCPAACNAN